VCCPLSYGWRAAGQDATDFALGERSLCAAGGFGESAVAGSCPLLRHFFAVDAPHPGGRGRRRDACGGGRGRELIALDAALDRLVQFDERKAKVIEMRFCGGLSAEETTAVLQISPPGVTRDWKLAKAGLERETK
jgi:hypothetical protein